MLPNESRFQISAAVDQIPQACDFVVQIAQQAGLDDHAVYHCQLAIDEACTNIIEHGYTHQSAHETIEIICRHEPARFSIIIVDSAPEFDPLTRTDPNPAASLEERTTGGWGIFFIKKLMDEVSYEHLNGKNYLTAVKYLPQ
jgi:anti-sigma regulatory factor (Ser/Thr protein kinase)